MPRERGKRWCITLNNYTEEEESSVQSLVGLSFLTYVVYGREVGTSGTPHLQMYVETKKKLSRPSILKMPGLSRASLIKANGSAEQNREYCTKESGFIYEEGEVLVQGKRNDLLEVKEDLDGGATMNDIAENHFSQWVRYHRSFMVYKSMKTLPRRFRTRCHVFWGKTGTGKTRWVWDQIQDSRSWTPGDYKWFDGYDGQSNVIFDDYRGEYPLQLLLKLIDRYPLSVPVKGAFVNWCPTKIYITSNISPYEWYPLADNYSRAALMRRFDLVQAVFEDLY